MDIYTCIHTYMATYIHTYLHTYIHTYINEHLIRLEFSNELTRFSNVFTWSTTTPRASTLNIRDWTFHVIEGTSKPGNKKRMLLVRVHTYIHAYIHTYIHTYTHLHTVHYIHYIHIAIHTYAVHTFLYTYFNTHTYIHIHTYICMCMFKCL